MSLMGLEPLVPTSWRLTICDAAPSFFFNKGPFFLEKGTLIFLGFGGGLGSPAGGSFLGSGEGAGLAAGAEAGAGSAAGAEAGAGGSSTTAAGGLSAWGSGGAVFLFLMHAGSRQITRIVVRIQRIMFYSFS